MNADYDRDGFLVVPDFLPAADCGALQARAAERAARCALDDVDRDNGCLTALAGAHRGPLRQRFRRSGEGTVMETVDSTPWPAIAPTPVEIRRGTLVVLHGLLPHASSANRSARSRHAYALHLIDRRAAYSPDNWLQRPDFPLRGFS